MILPKSLWNSADGDIAVEIDGVTYLETPEEAARLVAEGKAKWLGVWGSSASAETAVFQ